MSGHSHWHSIKYQKGIADAKKSKFFSKMVREITVAVREGGSNPDTNSRLRLAVDRAKSINMPAENIERAIKKGAGELEGAKLELITIEAYGPGGIALIIEGITDNKNRALPEIKQALNQNQGKLVSEGSVRWLFERKGVITVDSKQLSAGKEELELKAIEIGAEDVFLNNDTIDIYTKIEDLEKIKKILEGQNIKIESASLDWVPKNYIDTDEKEKELAQGLFDALDGLDSVQEIYSNLKT
jgi:YebC/PmpR family DNA-binding regulatory protein